MTTISETDLKVFANLANPQKANISKLTADDDGSSIVKPASSKDNSEVDDSEDDQPKSHVSRYSGSHAASHVPSHVPSHAQSYAQSFAQNYAQRNTEEQNYNDSDAESEKSRNSDISRKSADSNSDDDAPASKVSYLSKRSQNSEKKSFVSNRSFGEAIQDTENEPTIKKRQFMNLPFLHTSQDEDSMNTLEKQQVLMDMERLKLQGITLSKKWTLNDRLDDMQFEVKRHMLHIDEMNNINMMRDGMRLLCSGFEMVNTKFGFLELEGWAGEVCSDMEKYDNALGRIYRKYWKRGTQNSPEMEIALGLIGSMGMYHFKKKMQNKMFGKKQSGMPGGFPFPGMAGLGGGLNFPTENTKPKYNQSKKNAISESDSSDDEDVPPDE